MNIFIIKNNAACIQHYYNNTDTNDDVEHEHSNDCCNDRNFSVHKNTATMWNIPEHHNNYYVSTFVLAMLFIQRKVEFNKLMNVNGNDEYNLNELRLNTMNSKEETVFKIEMNNDKSIEFKKDHFLHQRKLNFTKELRHCKAWRLLTRVTSIINTKMTCYSKKTQSRNSK